MDLGPGYHTVMQVASLTILDHSHVLGADTPEVDACLALVPSDRGGRFTLFQERR